MWEEAAMRAGTMLMLLAEAMQITNKMALANFRELTSNESRFREDIISLLGYLKALEAVVKQEAENSLSHQEQPVELDETEVRKIEKRLRLWSRKPDQINSLILSCFLRLKYEDRMDPIPVDALKERYVRERSSASGGQHGDIREFDANFWLMRLIGKNNHGKVFDIDSRNNVTIWPKAAAAVEKFRLERGIGPAS